ncbi:T9SS type A sorting domain-containing protein [Patescibacteria group bacterium]|nr:T9SS type A sorting domain-containing protein [Patescibacteria group bacterium]
MRTIRALTTVVALLLVLLLVLPNLTFAKYSPLMPVQEDRIITGAENVIAPVIYPPYAQRGIAETDIVGDTVVIGTTWYENQHNGTIGRMVEKDELDYIHFVWMNGLDTQSVQRHVYYNYIDPEGAQGWHAEGTAVETTDRGGYTTLDVDFAGIAFPSFHQIQGTTSMNAHAAVACDFFPHVGAFLNFECPWVYEPYPADLEVIWPRIQFSSDQLIRVIATENPASLEPGSPQRQYYITGTYIPASWQITYDSTWTMFDWTMTIASDIATSDASNKVAVAWTYPLDPMFPDPLGDYAQWDNDIWVLIDDDGLDLNFDEAFNITNFFPPDTMWYPDTLMAQMDTLRVYTDLNAFIDMNDYTHVAFTTRIVFPIEGSSRWNASLIWHWSEENPGEYSIIAKAYDDPYYEDPYCGAWNVKAQRPSLGQDPSTGYLYCMYQQYDTDTTALSATPSTQGWGFPSGEVFISMSTDGGLNWSEGINVTNTVTPYLAAPGQCLSELSPTMAKLVDGACHIMYILDKDAGFVIQEEGTYTFNNVIYHTVPITEIEATPLVEQDIPFHVEQIPGFEIPGSGRYATPRAFDLRQNYPNPFNPATSISFSLEQVSQVSLTVYNLKGEQVAQITSGTYGSGQHTVTFDAMDLSSGVYVYKLLTGKRSLARKMLLVK